MDSTSTLRGVAARALIRLLSRSFAFGSARCLSVGCLLAFVTMLPSSVSAQLVLISEARSVFVSYYGGGIETHSSDGNFGLFEASASGIPFGGGGAAAGQRSDITPDKITLEHGTVDGFGPGAVANSNFLVKFSLLEATRITISGYSNYFSGDASLISESTGPVSLVWGPDYIYKNFLNFDEVLNPGVYTFSSYEYLRGDYVTTKLELRAQAVSVPEGGTSVGMFAVGLLSLLAVHAKRRLVSAI